MTTSKLQERLRTIAAQGRPSMLVEFVAEDGRMQNAVVDYYAASVVEEGSADTQNLLLFGCSEVLVEAMQTGFALEVLVPLVYRGVRTLEASRVVQSGVPLGWALAHEESQTEAAR